MSKTIKTWIGVVSFVIASLFLCYEMGLQVALAVVTTPLMQSLHMDAAHLGWLTGCYFFAYTLMQIPGGVLFDRFSCRHIMTLSALCCAIGAFLFSNSHAYPIIFLSRFMIGAGSAFPFVGVLMVASKCFKDAMFPVLVGVTQCLAALGAFMGTAPLSALVDKIGWLAAMSICAYIGFAIVVLLRFGMAKLPAVNTTERTSILDDLKTIVQKRETWVIAAYAFLNWGPVIVFTSLWGEPFLERKMHIDTTQAAILVQNIWLGIALGSLMVGALSKRFNSRQPFMMLCAGLGLLCTLLILYGPMQSLGLVALLFFTTGIAASGQILSFAMVKDLQPEKIVGTAIGFNNMAVVAGGFVLQPLIGELMQWFWQGKYQSGIPFYALSCFQYALAIVPLCFGLCLLVSFWLADIKRHD